MAKVLDDWEFGRMSHGGISRYEKFLDGQIWELTLEDSYNGDKIESFRTTLQGAARRKGLRSRTQILRTYELNTDTGENEITDEILIFQTFKDEEDTED